MRIALDLDGTVIQSDIAFPLEPVPAHPLFLRPPREKLRLGTVELATYIREAGHELWVYTSSYRKKSYIRRLFSRYGITLDGVVNQPAHDKTSQNFTDELQWISKYPPAFGIDLLVEDSEGVKQEGETWDFRVLVVQGNDENWVAAVKAAVSKTHS
jgi:hypothetical protein